MNRVLLSGGLTRDSELIKVGEDKLILKFSIAHNRFPGADAEYFDVVMFGDRAAKMHGHLVRGKQVDIDGRLKSRRLEDGQGRTHTKYEIHAEEVQFRGPNRARREE